MVKNHFIITCGTSLIDSDNRRFCSNAEDVYSIVESELDIKGDINTDFLQFPKIMPNIKEFADEILECKKNDNNVGKPFGAELSSLFLIEKEFNSKNITPFNPQEDEFTLIVSQTRKGLFAAGVIMEIMKRKWFPTFEENDQVSNINLYMIEGLSDEPDDANKVLENLAITLTGILSKYAIDSKLGDDQWNNVIVITGGYKSTIPVLSIISLILGIDIFYLFERSTELIVIQPRFISKSKNLLEDWISIWKQFSENNDEALPTWLKTILDFRMKYPDLVLTVS